MVSLRLAEVGLPALSCKEMLGPGTPGSLWLDVASSARAEKLLAGLPKPGAQGYRLAAGEDWMAIHGTDPAGLFYGLMTLRQLIRPDGRIPRVAVSDWPDLPVRGAYISVVDPADYVRDFAAKKINLLLMEYGDLYRLDDPEVRSRWQACFDLCRRHFIEPVPELQSLGWGHFVLALEPRAAEGTSIENQPFVAKHGQLVPGANEGAQPPSPLKNVLITEAAPLVVTDAAGATPFEQGRDYRVVPGDPLDSGDVLKGIAGYVADVEPMRLEVLPEGRIHEGDGLLVSYTYAPPGSITCCPSEPLYQALMRRSLRNVVEHLAPEYIHIGHDEPRVLGRDRRCKERGLSRAQLFVDDIKRMREYARERDPDVRLMMWADAVNPHHNEPHLGMDEVADLLPRDIVMCTWFYHWPDPTALIRKSVAYFTDLGFDVTGSPWYGHANAHHWAGVLAERRQKSPRVLGELYTSWPEAPVDRWQALPTMAEFAWNAASMPLAAFLEAARE